MSIPGFASRSLRSLLALCLLLVVQATHAAAETVRLAWNPSPDTDIAGYLLEWGPTPGTYATSVTVTPSTTSYDVTELPEGTYYFAVRAFNGAGLRSEYSNEVSASVTSSYVPASPSILSLSPGSGPTSGGTDVTITGTNFLSGASVHFGSLAATVLQQSATSLLVRTPAASAGTVAVSVTNPDGGAAAMPSAFAYVAPPPSVTTISPTFGPTTGGTSVTLTGSGFRAGIIVRFGALLGTVTSVSGTTVVVRTPAQPQGPVHVSVQNSDDTAAQAPTDYTYQLGGPTITTFSPTQGTTAGGTEVVVNGSNFQAGLVVRFGTLPGVVSSVTSTRITVRTPSQARGSVSLTVVNPDGNAVTAPKTFTYKGKTPTVTALDPVIGAVTGGTEVVFDGADFESDVSVSVNGVPATVVSVRHNRLVVRMPAHAPGIVDVVVTNPESQPASRPGAFKYVTDGPAITHVLPRAGSVAGDTPVTIVGSGFSAGATVTFGGVPATVLTTAPELITVRTPAGTAGPASVLVRNADGVNTTAVDAYSYEDPSEPFVRYFAEGASGNFFETHFALANPHGEPVPVDVTFTDTHGAATTMQVVVPATSRMTIDGSNRPALASDAFATTFQAPKIIGVERTMRWAAGGPAYGAHSETGVAAPRTSWVLAEGATIGGFNTFYLLQNPTATATEVKVQYLLATGERIEKTHPVAPLSRTNIWVNKEDPKLEAAEMSATLTSLNAVPVVVERSMYRNNGNELFSAGHNSAAVDTPALRWFLAEGATGGTFDEFVLIANPNPTAAQLRVSYLRAGQAPIVKAYVAGAQSRLTIWVDQEAPELAQAEVSVVVESLTPTPIVVERSMWWRADAAGEWVEAHNSRGVTATAARWLVADGEAGGPGQASTYVLVANTGGAVAPVRFTLLTESGATRTVEDVVTANGRYSLDVAGTFPEARHSRFSLLVESADGTAPLVVERASYSSTATTRWAAGTNSLAIPLP